MMNKEIIMNHVVKTLCVMGNPPIEKAKCAKNPSSPTVSP
ncbi:hypothetical protein LPE509_02137 [Legionella pneumophila subsp. pneumophila LPE509]|nr:hypothetical protein LPE509_02137 [Legionella pneumophila subsp. pneumophila LPE509]